MKKTATLLLALACTATISAESVKTLKCGDGIPGRDEPQLNGLAISANGHYVCGAIEYGNGFFVADALSGVVKYGFATGDEGGELRGVDNNGVAVGYNESGITYAFATGTETEVAIPEGYRSTICEDITEDGSMIVGSISGQSFLTTAAYMKDGGEWMTLPFPTDEQFGELKDKVIECSAAKHVSSDGKIIMGYLGSFTVPVVWVMNDKGEYEVDFFPVRYLKFSEADENNDERPLHSISGMYFNMSNNGKYICLVGLVRDKRTGDLISSPVIYNTEERAITVYGKQDIDDFDSGLYPTAICDDGTFIGTIGQPYFQQYGTFIMEAGDVQASTFTDTFPVFAEDFGEGDYYGFNMPTSMSADGNYILGYTYYCSNYNDEDADAYYVTYIIDRKGGNSVEKISENAAETTVESIYGIDGQRHYRMTKGINLVRMSDGSTRKIMVK